MRFCFKGGKKERKACFKSSALSIKIMAMNVIYKNTRGFGCPERGN